MKIVSVYSLNEIRDILLKYLPPDSESYIEDALFEWARYERFIHINVDKLENISVEYEEDARKYSVNGEIPNKIQKWIEIVNELIRIIESCEFPEEFIIDYESDISIYK